MKVSKKASEVVFKPFILEITFENQDELDALKRVLNHNKTAWQAINTEFNYNHSLNKVWDNVAAKMYSLL